MRNGGDIHYISDLPVLCAEQCLLCFGCICKWCTVRFLNIIQVKACSSRRKLTQEELERREKETKLSEVDGRALQTEEELNILRRKVKDMQEEMQQNERALKAEVASLVLYLCAVSPCSLVWFVYLFLYFLFRLPVRRRRPMRTGYGPAVYV